MARGKSGFSLVEALVALAVLAVIALPMTGMLVSSLRAANMAGLSSRALNAAQTRVEEIASLPAGELRAAGRRSFDEGGGLRSVCAVTPDSPEPGLCLIVVEVFEGDTRLAVLEDVLYAP